MERRYAIIAEPELAAADRDWIEAWRRRHDSVGQSRVGPHVTLFFAAAFPDPAPLAAAVERAGAAHTPFQLRLAPIVVLPDIAGGAVVALGTTAGCDACVALHDKLYEGALARHLRTDIPYVPHLTLGRRSALVDAQALATAVAAEGRSIPARVGGLRIVEIGERAAIPVGFRPLADRPQRPESVR